MLFSSLMVILVRNSVYSALFLILCFIMSSGLLFLIESEFLGLIFLIIYVGAIAVLFLFVVMMLNIKVTNSVKNILKYFPLSNFIIFVFLIEILLIIFDSYKINPYKNSFLINLNINWYDKIDSISDIEALGQIIYTNYVIQFLIAGIILLIAVIGSVILTLNKRNKKIKFQDTFRQVSR